MKDIYDLVTAISLMVCHHYTRLTQRQQEYLSSLSRDISKKPTKYILVPISIAFLVAYPSLCGVWSSYVGFPSSVRTVNGGPLNSDSSSYQVKQFWIRSDGGVLNKEFLLKMADLQDEMLERYHNVTYIHSALEFWNNNRTTISADPAPLLTVQKHSKVSPLPLHSSELFGGVRKLNGLMKRADAFLITVIMNGTANLNDTWTESCWAVTEQSHDYESITLDYGVNWPIASLIFLSVALIYCALAFMNFHSVRSKTGLLFGFLVESILSIFAAATTLLYFVPETDIFYSPVQSIPLSAIAIATENTFRLSRIVSRLPGELCLEEKVKRGSQKGTSISLPVVTAGCFVTLCSYWLSVEYRVFVALCIVIQYGLHLTHFTAVLAVDTKRSELEDLIKQSSAVKEKMQGQGNNVLSTSLLGSYDKRKSLSFRQGLGQQLLKPRLPVGKGIVSSLTVFTLFLMLNTMWLNGGASIDVGIPFWLNKKPLLQQLISGQTTFKVFSPIYMQSTFPTRNEYRYDILFALEGGSLLAFIVCLCVAVMKIAVEEEKESSYQQHLALSHKEFNAKELIRGHRLDVVSITTSSCPFVVSVGLDHRVLVWSPMAKPLPRPISLPISVEMWPITLVSMSSDGSLVAVFNRRGSIRCWCRLSMSWIWSVHLEELESSKVLDSFFRVVTQREVKRRKNPNPGTLHNPRTMSIDSSYDQFGDLRKLKKCVHNEFVLVLSSGTITTISCETGSLESVKLAQVDIATARRLSTPRVNDRIVCCAENGTLIVATVINNKWKARKLSVQEGNYNSGKSLPTPAAMSRVPSINPPKENEPSFKGAVISLVPFVGMVVRAHGLVAELIDVQTGTLVKSFQIGQFKPSSFKVFHSSPAHCRFCGCASVSSFSIAYMELETDTLILHTFVNDNRAKSSICMRVERDPRETRCIGFEAVNEYQHWLSNVESWCLSDLNMLIGIRRREVPTEQLSAHSAAYTSGYGRGEDKWKRKPSPHLNSIWEGWTLAANGKVKYFDIPNGTDEGLLVKKPGPTAKFGHKSIVVAFGNVMKVFYLGNDNLIEENADASEDAERSSALSFINRRRKMILKKYELTHSTNFNDNSDLSESTND